MRPNALIAAPFRFVLDVLYSKNPQKLTYDNVLAVLSAAQYLKARS